MKFATAWHGTTHRRARGLACMVSCLAAGCVSGKDLGEDGFSMTGGGYYTEEVGPGLFYVVARSTVGPVENLGAARSMWSRHAEARCRGGFQELEIVEYIADPAESEIPGMPYLVSTRKGYALCATSPLQPEEAMERLDDGARIEPGALAPSRETNAPPSSPAGGFPAPPAGSADSATPIA